MATIQFLINYKTQPGQEVYLSGNHPVLGNFNLSEGLKMSYLNANQWVLEVVFKESLTKLSSTLSYRFFVRNADGTAHFEGGVQRRLPAFPSNKSKLLISNVWTDASWDHMIFETAPFQNALMPNTSKSSRKNKASGNFGFAVRWPFLPENFQVCLLGSIEVLGNWNPEAPLLMTPDGHGNHFASVELAHVAVPFSYKYGLYDAANKRFLGFEQGDNRKVNQAAPFHDFALYYDSFLRIPAPLWKGAGVAVPIFSLRTKSGIGVGEFTDLRALVDWCTTTGIRLIQVLPVNDTTATHTWTDSYPYAAVSAFALHPMYLNLEEVAKDLGLKMSADWKAKIKKGKETLNASLTVDYEGVNQLKKALLEELIALGLEKTMSSADFKTFYRENQSWLPAYAAFCFFRDLYGTAVFSAWPEHNVYDISVLEKLAESNPEFKSVTRGVAFTQFHLHRQLQQAHQYALSQGVVFKGDVPIGIYRHSADAWQQPHLYHMNRQAGAPPDDFAIKGQNWGFPTYNWPRMAEDGFKWWQQRFAQMRHYYDAFRIDHILGFFRIWSIPMDAVEGIMGYFEPAIPVAVSEFADWGIPFDRARFVEPYIDDEVLLSIFGTQASLVIDRFLTRGDKGRYQLQPAFQSQQLVAAYFESQPKNAKNTKLKTGLFDLISNVILFEVLDGDELVYHFRFYMSRTTSFMALPKWMQDRLESLYNDYFFVRQDTMWEQEALRKLPELLSATDMLVCGEDLGLVPACVPDVMKRCGLLSLEVQRMPKDSGVPFLDLGKVPYKSVATPASHDTSTIRGWWKEAETDRETYFLDYLSQTGSSPTDCTGDLVKLIIESHLHAPSMWAIFQLQDWLGMDEKLRYPDADAERINVPANPKHYWRWRFHMPLEQLKKQKAFNNLVKGLVSKSGR
jgi:4-alpha-glucanotransferase